MEDITNTFKGVEKSFAIQAGREIRVMVVPDQVNDADMVLLARDIAKQIEAELEYRVRSRSASFARAELSTTRNRKREDLAEKSAGSF